MVHHYLEEEEKEGAEKVKVTVKPHPDAPPPSPAPPPCCPMPERVDTESLELVAVFAAGALSALLLAYAFSKCRSACCDA